MLYRILSITIFIIILFGLAGCGNVVKPTEPDWVVDGRLALDNIPGGSNFSLIAFSRQMGDYPVANRDLYVMTPSGLFETQITSDIANDDHAAFSPNGRSLSFASNRSGGATWGNHDVFRYTPWGGVTQLTDDTWQWDTIGTDHGPGFIIAARLNVLIGAPFDVVTITAYDPWGCWEVFVPTGHGASYAPNLNKGASAMVFAARPAGNTYFGSMELYILYRGETGAHQLTAFGKDPDNMVFTTNPSFDFQNNRVVFQTSLWDGNSEIGYVYLDPLKPMPYGPADAVRVTNNPASDVQPCFSPDGHWMAIATDRDGNFEIYKVWDPNSLAPPPINPEVRLTFTPQNESNPDWSDYY